jgi:hypothetical protein
LNRLAVLRIPTEDNLTGLFLHCQVLSLPSLVLFMDLLKACGNTYSMAFSNIINGRRTLPASELYTLSGHHLSSKIMLTFVVRGVSHGQCNTSLTAINLGFIDWSSYFFTYK